MFNRRVIFKIYVLPFFLLIFLQACGEGKVGKAPLPEKIRELRLDSALDGEKAEEMIDKLHGKNVGSGDNYIGFYRGGGYNGTLYVSEFETSKEAISFFNKMSEKIRLSKGGPFSHFRTMKKGKLDVNMVLGLGQAHYFYARKNKLIWLGIDIPIAQQTLDQLLVMGY